MGWSANFILELHKRNNSPRFLLEHVAVSGFQPGSGLALASHQVAGYRTAICRSGSRITAGQLEIGSWSYSVPELTVGIDADVTGLVTRGQLVVFRVGWPGWAPGDFEPVFYGHLQSVERSGDDWTLTVRHVIASLVSRMTADVEVSLFDGLDSTEIVGDPMLGTGWAPGETTMYVDDASAAEVEGGGGGLYLLQVIPEAGGDPFFLTATGKTADTFTGVAGPILGSTAAAAGVGSEVKFGALMYDSPTRAIRRVLMTVNGDASNGLYDTLPFSWGLGIPQEIVDNDDCDRTKDLVAPSGAPTSKWHLWSVEPQDDGLSFINGALNPAGMFVCDRQGRLTIRAMSAASVRDYAMTVITDADIASIDRHERWSGSNPVEYAFVSARAINNTFGSDVDDGADSLDTRPASGEYHIDLDHVNDDDTDWEEAVLDRVSAWYLRPPEVVTVTCIGLRLAFLAPADQVQVASRHVRTRDRSTDALFKVLSVGVDWFEGTVTLMLAYHPPVPREF